MISDACKHVYDELSFIWCVLYSYFGRGSLEDAVRQVSSMYEHDFCLTPEFEELLLKFWESGCRHDLVEFVKRVLEKFLLSTTNHVLLVALLVDAGELSIKNASKLLQISPDSEEDLSDEVSHILDVAWLTNEDEKDKFMSPDADDVLIKALKKVKESLLSAN